MDILQTCLPRHDIISGKLNLEIFTASLDKVIKSIHGQQTDSSDLYTDGHKFLTEGTYPTEGLKRVLRAVLGRLSGDSGESGVQRLDTAFGGGKTHSLIACVHAAARGKELEKELAAILGPEAAAILPEPGEVQIVGLSCDKIDLRRNDGLKSSPYTLWGEMAMQLGGESLYQQELETVENRAAPKDAFYDRIFRGRKTLILIDEIASYIHTAGNSTAPEDVNAGRGAADFIMYLGNYVKEHSNIVMVITLASSKDAFSDETAKVQTMLGDLGSVTARVAATTTPVSPDEISSVLARRLFERIDPAAARSEAETYSQLYQRHKAALPEDAAGAGYTARMEKEYPFHPSFMDFLNKKLSVASEKFQGTRGVLRLLALTVKDLWKQGVPRAMIHTGDINLDDSLLCDELFSRSAAGPELKAVLTADVRSGSSDNPARAEALDRRYSHPSGIAVYRDAWQSVFLNSLADTGNFKSKAYGATKALVTLETLRPGISAANVENALKALEDEAYYLRKERDIYCAALQPTVNKALQQYRSSITPERVWNHVHSVTARLIKKAGGAEIIANVKTPAEIPDTPRLQLVLPALDITMNGEAPIDPGDYFTCASGGAPRLNQNSLIILMPRTVSLITRDDSTLFGSQETSGSEESLKAIRDTALDVIAREYIDKHYDEYGLTAESVGGAVRAKMSERAIALATLISKAYSTVMYPAAGEACFRSFDIQTTASEGGADMIDAIVQTLESQGELITDSAASRLRDLLPCFCPGPNSLQSVGQIRKALRQDRRLPMLRSDRLLDTLMREGLRARLWWLVSDVEKDPSPKDSAVPNLRYGGPTEEGRPSWPLPADQPLQDDWIVASSGEVRQRGWDRDLRGIDPEAASRAVRDAAVSSGVMSVARARQLLAQQYPQADAAALNDAAVGGLLQLIGTKQWLFYSGREDRAGRPADLRPLDEVSRPSCGADSVIISNAEAVRRGWNTTTGTPDPGPDPLPQPLPPIRLEGEAACRALPRLLRRLPSLRSGARSALTLEMYNVPLGGGAEATIQLTNLTPQTLAAQRDLLAALASAAESAEAAGAEAVIAMDDPQPGCALAAELDALRREKPRA